MKEWFKVDTKGLKTLIIGKKKIFVINELVQNCWDEPITYCKVNITWLLGKVTLLVEDDSPEGFRNIEHAYTLFADTYKRGSPIHRGKFNLGEKLVLAICYNYGAEISTTTGTIEFHPTKGRIHHWSQKRKAGSIFKGTFRATKEEFEELVNHARSLLPPSNIKYYVNDELIPQKIIYKSFKTTLDTEIYVDNIVKIIRRETEVHLVESEGQSFIFEMGIPIMETDCKWHIDVQQRVPLTLDRESIRPSYLKTVYAEVLNQTCDNLNEEEVSTPWVRTGFTDDRTTKDAASTVMTKRYGEKYLSRSPFDENANDEATSENFNLINGAELSKDEWNKLKENDLIRTASDLFGREGVPGTEVEPTPKQKIFADFAKKFAKEFIGINISVHFIKAQVKDGAYFGGNELEFIINKLPKNFFDEITEENINLLIHELGHHAGLHTDMSYHRLLTKLGAKGIMMALKKPSFFSF
jgi:hypothetical protein